MFAESLHFSEGCAGSKPTARLQRVVSVEEEIGACLLLRETQQEAASSIAAHPNFSTNIFQIFVNHRIPPSTISSVDKSLFVSTLLLLGKRREQVVRVGNL